MTIRLILQGFAILIFLSSCSKEVFLFPSTTGSYGSLHKSEQIAETSYKTSSHENTEGMVTAATYTENDPVKPLAGTAAHGSQVTVNSKVNIPLRLNSKAFGETENKALKNHLKAFTNKKAGIGTKVVSEERTGFIFSVLSLVSGLASVFLTILLGHFIYSLLGILAVICGLISLSKKEKFKGLAITGLIFGFLGILLLLILLTFWDTGSH